MSLEFGDLAQASPGAAVLADLFTCPAGFRATGRLHIANRNTATTIRVALAIGGAADAVQQYKAWDMALDSNEGFEFGPFTLDPGDVVRVQSASGDVSFSLNGYKESV